MKTQMMYVCDYCNKMFDDENACLEHEKLHPSKKEFEIIKVSYENTHSSPYDIPSKILIRSKTSTDNAYEYSRI